MYEGCCAGFDQTFELWRIGDVGKSDVELMEVTSRGADAGEIAMEEDRMENACRQMSALRSLSSHCADILPLTMSFTKVWSAKTSSTYSGGVRCSISLACVNSYPFPDLIHGSRMSQADLRECVHTNGCVRRVWPNAGAKSPVRFPVGLPPPQTRGR